MKYKLEEKNKIILEYKKEEVSKLEFCKKNDISIPTLNRWLREKPVSFLEIKSKNEKFQELPNIKLQSDEDKPATGNLILEYGDLKITITSDTKIELLEKALKVVISVC